MKAKYLPAILCLCIIHSLLQAQQPAYNQNNARSNKTKAYNQNEARGKRLLTDAWNFGIGSGGSFGVNSNENTLFRGNSIATKMFGRYYFGNIGLGLTSGIIPGNISDNSLNNFLTERKLIRDQLQIQSGKPFNGYLAFGPSFRFGNRIQIAADLQGGMFLNNPGSLSIGQLGAQRALYRFDNAGKNFYPGFTGNINIVYPFSKSTNFFLSTDYLQSKSSIRLLDLARGIDVPAEQSRNIKLFTVGVGITKSFNTKRVLPTVNKKEIAIDESGVHVYEVTPPREIATGQSSGRLLPTVNKREISIGEPGVQYHEIKSPRDVATGQASGKTYQPGQPVYGNITRESCGPVTVKTTNADGTSSEMTFACPADAIDYQSRMSMNVTTPKQTQGTTFGEKVNQGLQSAGSAMSQGKQGIVHRDLAARNILAGRVMWTSSQAANPNGIVTNKTAAVSSVSSLSGGGGAAAASYAATGKTISNTPGTKGVVTNIYAREAGSGMATGKREKGSGLATGKRQYEPVFFEETGKTRGTMGTVQSNPLYVDRGMGGDNPLYEQGKTSPTKPDTDGDGIADITVHLIDAVNGATVASTKTESDGTFYFANVPSGNYVVNVTGGFIAKKGYDYYMAKAMDVAGEVLAAEDYFTIDIITDTGTVETAQAVVKTKTKSNQSNDRTAGSNLVWSPRSNRVMNITAGDLDGDGKAEIIVGNGGGGAGGSLGGYTPDLMPGNPIGGLTIKGGKNPGGNLRTTQTNQYGEFEFTDLEPGNYTFTAEMNYFINDETFVEVGQNIVTSESNLKNGPVKITATQNSQSLKQGINGINNNSMPNRISMNVTVPKQTQGATFGERAIGPDMEPDMVTKAQNNNTVRSNRTDNAIVIADLDGDGQMESSYLNINGEIATINITEPGVHVAAGDNAAGGINITEPGVNISNLNITEQGTHKVVEKATSGLRDPLKTQVKMTGGNTGPVKWMAPEVLNKRVWGDPHVDEKDGSLVLSSNSKTSVKQNEWKCQDICLKAIRCADGVIVAVTAKGDDYPAQSRISLNGLPPGQPVIKAAIYFTDNNGNIYKRETDGKGRVSLNGLPPGTPLRMMANMGVDGADDILITFTTDAQGNAISNVLKTKHDTAKNAIGNIR